MHDSSYYQTVLAIMSSITVPATDPKDLRDIADVVEATQIRLERSRSVSPPVLGDSAQ